MATDLSNAVHKKNTRNANNDVSSIAPVSNNQDLLDLLDLDLSAPSTTSIMPGMQQLATTGDHGNVNNMSNIRGLDLNLGFGGLDTMSSSIPTNGNDLASMLGGLSALANPVLPGLGGVGVGVGIGVGDINSSNLLGELNATTATNNVTVVRAMITLYRIVYTYATFIAASAGTQVDGPGQERTAGAAGAGEGQ